MPDPDDEIEIGEDSDVEWIPTDHRRWVPVTWHRDEITARMNATYLDTYEIEARVAKHDDHFAVEVPYEQLDHASAMSEGLDSGIITPMQEVRSKTGVHTGRHIKAMLAQRAEEGKPGSGNLVPWILIAVATLAAATIVWLLIR